MSAASDPNLQPLTPLSAAVLLVDDNPTNRFAARAAIESLGHTVVEADTGEEALRQLLVRDFAVVLLDVRLPGMSGVQVAELARKRERTRHVPIIFLTGESDQEVSAKQAYRLGALDYVLKPVDPDILRAKVTALADLWLRGERLRREESQLRRREKAASEDLLHRVMESSPLGIVSSDGAGVVLDANDAFLRMIGRGREQLGSLRWSDLVHDGAGPILEQMSSSLREQGSTAPAELELDHSDGTLVPVLITTVQVEGRGSRLSHVFDLRERRQAERQRDLQRAQLDTLFMQAPAAISIIRVPAGVIELANPNLVALLGGRELVGRSAREALPELAAIGLLEALETIRTTRQGLSLREQRLPRPHAAEGDRVGSGDRFLNVIHQPRLAADGTVEAVITFAFDVSEEVLSRKRAEQLATDLERQKASVEAARASSAALLEAMPQMVWTSQPDGPVSFLNERWLRFAGRSREELLGESWTRIVHLEDLREVEEAWRHSLSTGTVFNREFRAVRSDGSHRWVLGRAVPLKDEAGRIIRWFGTCTDVDAQHRERDGMGYLAAASDLLSSSLDYQDTLTSLAQLAVPRFADFCAVDMVGPEGDLERLAIAHVNPGQLELARQLMRLMPPRKDAPTGSYHVLRTGTSERVETITREMVDAAVPDPEARRVLHAIGLCSTMQVPLLARGRALGVITFAAADSGYHYTREDLERAEDLARRAALAVDNARLFRESQDAIRLRDEFLSVASHELKTPLTPLTLRLQTLRQMSQAEVELDALRAQVGRTVESAQTQLKRLTLLVNDLLDVSRIAQGRLHLNLESVDLSTVVREVVANFAEQAARAQVSLEVLAPFPVTGRWDRLRLDQVVSNLVTNAIKYGAGNPVRLVVSDDEDRARLAVRDEGIGIPAEDLARIFGRFERAVSERNYGGLGLGLYISQQIVHALGGTIRAESSLGHGATFIVELPHELPNELDTGRSDGTQLS